jgi:hypothetical protein
MWRWKQKTNPEAERNGERKVSIWMRGKGKQKKERKGKEWDFGERNKR